MITKFPQNAFHHCSFKTWLREDAYEGHEVIFDPYADPKDGNRTEESNDEASDTDDEGSDDSDGAREDPKDPPRI